MSKAKTQTATAKANASARAQAQQRLNAQQAAQYASQAHGSFGTGHGTAPATPAGSAAALPSYGGTAPTTNPLLEGLFGTATGNADTAYGNTLLGFTNDENALGADYGFNIIRGDGGDVNTGLSEASVQGPDINPFAKMSLLTRAYQQQQAGTTNNYASQGQGYSGAYTNAQANDTFNNSQAQDALRKAFEASIRQDTQGRLTAGDTKRSAYDTAGWNKLQGYLTNGQ